MSLVGFNEEILNTVFVIPQIIRGSDRTLLLTVYKDGESELYTGLVTATAITFEVYRGDIKKGTLVITKSLASGVTVPEESKIQIVLVPVDNENLSVGEYGVLISITDVDGKILRIKGVMYIQ